MQSSGIRIEDGDGVAGDEAEGLSLRVAVNAWFLDAPGTGSGQYLQGLLRGMAALGGGESPPHLLLVTPPGSGRPELPGLSVEWWAPAGSAWRSNAGKVAFEQVIFPRACRRWAADVAHVPYWGSPLRPPVPTLVTVHDLIPLLLPAYRGGPLVRLYTRLASAAARRASLVLTDSQASKADIEAHLRLPGSRVRAIYLAVDERFTPEPQAQDAAVRRHYGLPHRYVLYLGPHDARKNVAGLLEAFQIVARADADVQLVVGGRLPEAGAPPLYDPRPLAHALGLEGEVLFTGWVAEEHKPALYRGAACAAFPSRYEGFGLPVLEALACGTPLVASSAASLPELVGDAGFALEPDDVQGMAGAMLACLVDETLARELRQRGPRQAARFSWTETARQTVAAYRTARRGTPAWVPSRRGCRGPGPGR
jgi:glycosyltransferase involved in cell wall biosynthesis